MAIEHESFLESLAIAGGNDLLQAVEAEFRMGWDREKVACQMEVNRMSEVSDRLQSAAVDGLGYMAAEIPEGQKRGVQHIWKHKEFREDYLKKHPQCRGRYRSAVPRTGWTPAQVNKVDPSPIFRASKYERITREVTAA
jgi:IS5 family transposase